MDFREFHARVCFQSARRLNSSPDLSYQTPKKTYFNIHHAFFMHFHEFYARARFQSARRINLSTDLSFQTQKTYISMYNITYKMFLQVLLIILPLFATVGRLSSTYSSGENSAPSTAPGNGLAPSWSSSCELCRLTSPEGDPH